MYDNIIMITVIIVVVVTVGLEVVIVVAVAVIVVSSFKVPVVSVRLLSSYRQLHMPTRIFSASPLMKLLIVKISSVASSHPLLPAISFGPMVPSFVLWPKVPGFSLKISILLPSIYFLLFALFFTILALTTPSLIQVRMLLFILTSASLPPNSLPSKLVPEKSFNAR